MPRAQASILVTGRPDEAADLFHDPNRRATWFDGFAHVVRVDPEWPDSGQLVWQSRPGGRGRVVERVTGPGTVAVEDETLHGVQTVTFTEEGDDTRVALALEFQIKHRTLLGPLQSFFVRRAMADSLRRTLGRFAVEREAELHM